MNETFLCDSLDEITEEHFKSACVVAMSSEEILKGLLEVNCSDEFVLYIGKEEALVYVRNWSGMLSLFIRSESGTWIDSSHIDGMGVDGVLEEAWQRFLTAKTFVKTRPEKAFKQMELENGTKLRNMCDTSRYIDYITKTIQNK